MTWGMGGPVGSLAQGGSGAKILTLFPGSGGPDLSIQSCDADFGSAASSSYIQVAVLHLGEGEHFPLPPVARSSSEPWTGYGTGVSACLFKP